MHWNGWAGRIFLPRFLIFDFQKSNPVRFFREDDQRELRKPVMRWGKVKTGALIVVERDVMLNEYIRTGIPLDSLVPASF